MRQDSRERLGLRLLSPSCVSLSLSLSLSLPRESDEDANAAAEEYSVCDRTA